MAWIKNAKTVVIWAPMLPLSTWPRRVITAKRKNRSETAPCLFRRAHTSGLHENRRHIWASFAGRLRMLRLSTVPVRNSPVGFVDVSVTVGFDVIVVHRCKRRGSETGCKLVGSSGHLVLEPRSNDASIGICDGDEEIRRGLTVGWLVAHVEEVLASSVCRSEVRHASFIDNAHLVKDLVERFGGLIDRDRGGQPAHICGDTKGTGKFKSSGRVKTTCGAGEQMLSGISSKMSLNSLVPAIEQTSRSHCF